MIISILLLAFAGLFLIQKNQEKNTNVSGVSIGEKAPSFTLESTQGDISLENYKGKNVILYFYEGNNCGACVDQLVELNENLDYFESKDAVVISAVTDPLPFQENIAKKYHIKTPMMYDPNHKTGSKYGVYNVPGGMDMGPVNTHSIFIIDKNGFVRWKEISAWEMYVPLDSIKRELEKL